MRNSKVEVSQKGTLLAKNDNNLLGIEDTGKMTRPEKFDRKEWYVERLLDGELRWISQCSELKDIVDDVEEEEDQGVQSDA